MSTIPSKAEVIDLTGLTDSNSEDGRDGDEDGSEDGSDTSEIEITLNEETRSQLQTAISTVSETRLRQLLRVLVETDISIEAALTRELVTLKRGTQRIVPRWETCGNCDEEFDTNTIREDTECSVHPGELKRSEDSFSDWDENSQGPMNTESNRRNYPECFQWTCCGEMELSSGCVRGEHRPAVARKRKRVEE
ncbi:hypothetical protein BYT27DRAFT_7206780 [Phlegmacium glaucopus]|nr:hypothetical protein BYT27DRAFT_7206780 [Phlegmacium glaucopus]